MASSPSYMSREQLSEIMRSAPDSVAVVDVRDEDHIGGHIRGSQHVPSSSLDYRIPQLVRTLKDKPKVVFHCALSQQRGPAAARRYMGEKERLRQKEKSAGEGRKTGEGSADGSSQNESNNIAIDSQEVYILSGGFTKWQDAYGLDKDLTENYQEDLWRF